VGNIGGSFFLGFIYAIAEKNQWASPELRLFFTVGFCGGFTTYSTFSFDLLRLGTDYGLIYPLLYAMASVTLGFLAVWGGTMVVRGL
jgi:CrcB protein